MDRNIILPVRFDLRGDGHRYAINDVTGDPERRARAKPVNEPVDSIKLMKMLMGIGTKDEDERGNLTEFFNAAGYVPRRGRKWREEDLTDAIVERWRVYRDITTEMATLTALKWGSKILDEFPYEIAERAMRIVLRGVPGTIQLKIGPTFEDGGYRPEYVSELETRDPLDVIWVNLQVDKLAGIGYQKCKSRTCRNYFELPFDPKRYKRKREYCSKKCKWKAQKEREQDTLNKQCHAALKRAQAEYRRMPAAQKSGNLSKDILDLIVRDWPEFPLKQNWITKELNKEKKHEQN